MTQKDRKPLHRLRLALSRERRTNRRLRALIDETQTEIRRNRHDLDVQFERLAQIQAILDRLSGQFARRSYPPPVNRLARDTGAPPCAT